MSQFYIQDTSGSGPVPPEVATSYDLDTGTAIPSGNILNVNGDSISTDSVNGIQTVANPNLSQNLEIALTNRLVGTASSVNASVEDIITFTLGATDLVYRFWFYIAGRDTATGDGVGYTIEGSVRTDGAAATVISVPNQDNDEDASLILATADLVASGNDIILQVTGVAGQTISYRAVGNYLVI
jgi:hypothetical protein